MDTDRRENPRTEAKGLKAKIIITHSNRSIMLADVNLLDVSRTGIKLRVQKPLVVQLGAKVQLEIVLPYSGVPVILDAVIVHEKFESEFGLHYIDVKPEDPLTELITQCEKRRSWID
jgi:hypothetical protein